MQLKLKTSVKITTRVHCPSCKTPFPVTPEPSTESLSARCPRCGASVTIPSRDIFNEVNTRVAGLGCRKARPRQRPPAARVRGRVPSV
jgi:PHP family Zn ribbon phosphoesterase